VYAQYYIVGEKLNIIQREGRETRVRFLLLIRLVRSKNDNYSWYYEGTENENRVGLINEKAHRGVTESALSVPKSFRPTNQLRGIRYSETARRRRV